MELEDRQCGGKRKHPKIDYDAYELDGSSLKERKIGVKHVVPSKQDKNWQQSMNLTEDKISFMDFSGN